MPRDLCDHAIHRTRPRRADTTGEAEPIPTIAAATSPSIARRWQHSATGVASSASFHPPRRVPRSPHTEQLRATVAARSFPPRLAFSVRVNATCRLRCFPVRATSLLHRRPIPASATATCHHSTARGDVPAQTSSNHIRADATLPPERILSEPSRQVPSTPPGSCRLAATSVRRPLLLRATCAL